MTARIGKVTGSKIDTPRNAQSGQVRLLQVQTGPSVQTLQLVPQAGDDTNPPDGSLVLCVQAAGRWFAIATFDGVEPSVAEGEKKLYSTDAGAVKASIHLKADGSIELNGNSKRFVTWDALNSALSTLCGLLASHVHPAHGTPSPTLSGLSCDISSAKTTTMKTGG